MPGEVKAMGIEVKLPDSVDNAIGNLIGPPTKGIGQTTGGIWELIFGPLDQHLLLRRTRYAHAVEALKLELDAKLNEIPEQKRIEPNTQIIMNALHDAESCVEEDILRGMFANLISSSVNADAASTVHASFSSIIRQFASYDATLLNNFSRQNQSPVANYQIFNDSSGYHTTHRNVLVLPEEAASIDLQKRSSSLTFLAKQGLLDIDYGIHFTAADRYDALRGLLEQICANSSIRFYAPDQTNSPEYPYMTYQRGIAALTDFGSQFLKACMG